MNTKKPLITLISAIGADGIIGINGRLPWYVPSELKFFKQKTMGHILIMGRKTAMEFPDGLVGRHIIAIGDSSKAEPNKHIWASSLEDSIEKALHIFPDKEIFVAGGASIYNAFLDADLIDGMHLSYIAPSKMKSLDGDDVARFPLEKIKGEVTEEIISEDFTYKYWKVR
jgi:dihydrofolate reductase